MKIETTSQMHYGTSKYLPFVFQQKSQFVITTTLMYT